MKPLRVEFRLVRPMRYPESPIHLDALLAWCAVREAEDAGDPDPLAAQERLPLAEDDGEGGRVWCASHLIWQATAPPRQMVITKRFEPEEYARRRGNVFVGGPNIWTQGSGPYKAFVIHHPVIVVDSVSAYCIGDPARIAELLARIQSIGKLRRIGQGMVSGLTVIPDDRAATAWRVRVMPRPVEGYAQSMATTRPPYWRREACQAAWVPITIPEEIAHG